MEPQIKKFMNNWKPVDHKKFETFWEECFREQFNHKFKPNAKCYSNNIQVTQYTLDGGSANKKTKVFEFDGLTVLTDDHKPNLCLTNQRTPVIINTECTVKRGSPQNALEYWTLDTKPSDGKLIKLMKFMDTNGSKSDRRNRLKRLNEKYPAEFPTEEDLEYAYLIGIDRYNELNLADNVAKIQNHIDKAFPLRRAKVTPITETNAILVTMDDFKIVASVLTKGQCADHLSTVFALSKNLNKTSEMKKLYFERALFELTEKAAGEDYALLARDADTEIPVTVLSSKAPNLHTLKHAANVTTLHGHNIETYRLRIKLSDLLRLCCVERTINDFGALQRLPDAKHMKMIAEEGLELEKEFVNPIVISTTHDFIVERDKSGNDYIKPSTKGSNFLRHYSWALIDGQHRVFSGYNVDLRKGNLAQTEFDAVIRILDAAKVNKVTRNDINADTFFDLNYRWLDHYGFNILDSQTRSGL